MTRKESFDSGPNTIRIGIMGTPVSSGNRGVLALCAALTRLCIEAAPEVRVSLFCSNRNGHPVVMRPMGNPVAVPMTHWRLSPRSAGRNHLFVIFAASLAYRCLPGTRVRKWISKAVPWIEELEATALVGDVRGGDSFSDIYGIQRFLVDTLAVLSVIAVKGRIACFPQTYGPFKSFLARTIARFVLVRSAAVFARDRESQRVAQCLLGPEKRVLLCPDVAFALHARRPEYLCETPPGDATLRNVIGLNINGLMFNGGYTGQNMFGLTLDYREYLSELVGALLTRYPGNLLLVPHTFAPPGDPESDDEACRQLRDGMPHDLQKRIRIVSSEYDAHELKWIIGQCEFFVGSRMHSCIAALSQGVPCVGVAYSMKFAGVFESADVKDWVVDGRTTSTAEAVARTLSLYDERDSAKRTLLLKIDDLQSELRETFAAIVDLARKESNIQSAPEPEPSRSIEVSAPSEWSQATKGVSDPE